MPATGQYRFDLPRVNSRRYRARMVDDLHIGRAANLLAALTLIAVSVIHSGSTLAQNTPQPIAPVAVQSTCSETMPDVDRVACWVSVSPEPVPAKLKPQPPLLRGSDGTTIIGPNSSR